MPGRRTCLLPQGGKALRSRIVKARGAVAVVAGLPGWQETYLLRIGSDRVRGCDLALSSRGRSGERSNAKTDRLRRRYLLPSGIRGRARGGSDPGVSAAGGSVPT